MGIRQENGTLTEKKDNEVLDILEEGVNEVIIEDRIFNDDQELVESTNAIHDNCNELFPADLKESGLYDENLDLYLAAFPKLLDPQNSNQNKINLTSEILKLIVKGRDFYTLPELYSIYWKYEDTTLMIFRIIQSVPD